MFGLLGLIAFTLPLNTLGKEPMIKRLILLIACFSMCGFGGVYSTNKITTILQGGQFSPKDISGLALWLDGSDTRTLFSDIGMTTLAENGQAVALWRDKSGNNNHATNGVVANMPKRSDNARNGKTGLLFDTTDFYHMYKTASFGTLNTVFFVVNAKERLNYALSLSSPVGSYYTCVAQFNNSNTQIHRGSGTPIMYLNGVIQGVVTRGELFLKGKNTPMIYSLSDFNLSGWTEIMLSGYTGALMYSGDMYDVLIYNRVLSTTERQQVEKYLSSKWAINLNNITNPSSAIDNILKMQTPVGAVYQGNRLVYNPYKKNYVKDSWMPKDITGCTIWLDASDNTSVSTSNGYVSAWSDKSGNNNHATQPVIANRRTYSLNSIVANNKRSVFSDGVSGTLCVKTPNITVRQWYIVTAYNNGSLATFNQYPTLLSGATSTPAVGSLRAGMGRIASANWFTGTTMWADGAAKNTNSITSTVALPMPLTVLRIDGETDGTQEWYIGCNILLADRTWDGPICEVVGYSSLLTDSDRLKLVTYLMNKWGIPQ
jgi:hypothetical protein